MAMTHRRGNCPSLPAELWASIITHLDDFTVWMVCRYVARMVRDEAERDFAKHRLPELISFRWSFYVGEDRWLDDAQDQCGGTCEMIRLCKYADDGERAVFDIQLACKLYNPLANSMNPPRPSFRDFSRDSWPDHLEALVIKRLTFSDTAHSSPKLGRLSDNDIQDPFEQQRFVYVGSNVNEVEIPGLHFDLHSQQLSFVWKQFLTDYFGEEAYVRRMRRNRGIAYTGSPTIDDLNKFKSMKLESYGNHLDSAAHRFFRGEIDVIGQSNAELYTWAYRIRSSRSHMRPDLENRMPLDIEDRMLQRLRGIRRRQLCEIAGVQNNGYFRNLEDGFGWIYPLPAFPNIPGGTATNVINISIASGHDGGGGNGGNGGGNQAAQP
ncbi:hypothetical protein CC86DRAFT_462789 [Ophiobolus disseminans]|uniref:F-box domain-containing protein n=1 Tax=Ophiobolus disseminans TaxID=1469910 RepID=A0A6A7AIJ8_9PLEO|nr:hypothetical protein CC86DRAFT_462789 [Ophiobolus disseminans]